MKRLLTILGILLLLQVGLTVWLGFTHKEYTTFEADQSLLAFDAKQVDFIRLEAPEEQAVELQKQDGKWYLPAHYNFPASETRVKELLERLSGLKKGWPAATTEEAAERFKVTTDNFVRRVILKKGDTMAAELLVGTSPGFRKSHVRAAGDPAIMVAEFSDFDAEARVDDWIDREILQFNEKSISRIDMPKFSLVRQDNELTVAGLAPGEQSVAGEVAKLAQKIAELTIESVLGPENKPDYHQDIPELVFTVKFTTGKQVDYIVSKPGADDHYVLKASNNDNYFKVILWQFDNIMDIGRDKLVSGAAADESDEAITDEPSGDESLVTEPDEETTATSTEQPQEEDTGNAPTGSD